MAPGVLQTFKKYLKQQIFSMFDYMDIKDELNIELMEKLIEEQKHIINEIERYSHYKLIVTDRYHGTIFSLVAGTPVIIIKTTDHKVITGAEWFKGLYDKYVYVANTLDDVS